MMPFVFAIVGSHVYFHPAVYVDTLHSRTCCMNCPYVRFSSIRHNELRDITASLLNNVCFAVGTKPCLEQQNKYKTANEMKLI